MKSVFLPKEPYGFEQILINDGDEIPKGATTIEPPVPNWKPFFNGTEWVELATEEEKNQGKEEDEDTPVDIHEELKKTQDMVQAQAQAIEDLANMIANGGVE